MDAAALARVLVTDEVRAALVQGAQEVEEALDEIMDNGVLAKPSDAATAALPLYELKSGHGLDLRAIRKLRAELGLPPIRVVQSDDLRRCGRHEPRSGARRRPQSSRSR